MAMISVGSVPFSVFSGEVLSLYQSPIRRVSTFRKMRQVLGEFAAICPGTADLSPAVVARWVADHAGRRAATVRTLLSTLRAACRYGEFRGYLRSPFSVRRLSAWVPRADDEEPVGPRLSAGDVGRVLALADLEALGGGWEARRLRVVVYLAAFTGARASEVLGLRVEDLDLVAGVLRITPNARRSLKTAASRRAVPIAGALRAVLEPWAGRADRVSDWLVPHTELDGPWLHGPAGGKAYQRVKALGERAGVPGATLLAFRHAFASAADEAGIGVRALQGLLGHSSPATQWHYRHADLGSLRRAVELVRFGDQSPPLPVSGPGAVSSPGA